MNLPDFHDSMVSAGRDLIAAFGPAMAGSGVGQAWSCGLSWRERTVQWLVGIMVSYYVTRGLSEIFGLGPFISQAIGFVIAMIAFEVAPKIITAASTIAARIPDYASDFIARFTKAPRRADDDTEGVDP
jgi:hypothetical protein